MNELSFLAAKYGTDKGVEFHGYTEIYDRYLNHLRYEKFTFLELGIGGYGNPNSGGESLRMWADYFPLASIHGLDCHTKKIEGRFDLHRGDQTDSPFLCSLIDKIGTPSVIVDDASHINEKTITSFITLFPLLKKDGGIYIIEDVSTSYISKEYGGSLDISTYNNDTVMGYFLHLVHSINIPNSSRLKPVSFHFHKDCIIIEK